MLAPLVATLLATSPATIDIIWAGDRARVDERNIAVCNGSVDGRAAEAVLRTADRQIYIQDPSVNGRCVSWPHYIPSGTRVQLKLCKFPSGQGPCSPWRQEII
ncbi:UNVERIFIED_ORG: hypothetical protein CLV66_105276 [Actinomadura viridilutea]